MQCEVPHEPMPEEWETALKKSWRCRYPSHPLPSVAERIEFMNRCRMDTRWTFDNIEDPDAPIVEYWTEYDQIFACKAVPDPYSWNPFARARTNPRSHNKSTVYVLRQ